MEFGALSTSHKWPYQTKNSNTACRFEGSIWELIWCMHVHGPATTELHVAVIFPKRVESSHGNDPDTWRCRPARVRHDENIRSSYSHAWSKQIRQTKALYGLWVGIARVCTCQQGRRAQCGTKKHIFDTVATL
jgi:hypothetical protein